MVSSSRFSKFFCAALGLGVLILAGCSSSEPETAGTTTTGGAAPSATVAFSTVQPILQAKCVGCHTGPGAKEGVDLSSYEAVMKGGKDGAIVKAGEPAGSMLVDVLRGTNGRPQMPPKQPPLSADEIKSIEDWVKAGATS